MQLMRATQFTELMFCEGSRPSLTSVRKWIEEGALPGRRIGRQYFVDYPAFIAGGDDLLARILDDGPAT